MEQWQKDIIQGNQQSLQGSINCNVDLIAVFIQNKVLSDPEVATLKTIGENRGRFEQSSKLLEVLMEKKGGFDMLKLACTNCIQTGALQTLTTEENKYKEKLKKAEIEKTRKALAEVKTEDQMDIC